MRDSNPNVRRAIGVASLFCAALTLALGQQTARFEITPSTALIDEPFRIALTGVPPGRDVTINVDGNNGLWQSTATFKSNVQGNLDIADPMRLIWSATGQRPATPMATPAQPWTFTAAIDGKVVATQTIMRRAFAQGVRIVPVRERGLVAMAYSPAQSGRHPAIIVLPGSQGGLPGPAGHAGGLASRGYFVLALAYFNAEGLPALLQNVPLEYFATAVEWLKAQPLVDPEHIGVLGTSRGGELALLLGATYPSSFQAVVANVPSSVVWPGLSDDSPAPAWTLGGKPVAAMQARFSTCLLYTSPSPRDRTRSRMPSSA